MILLEVWDSEMSDPSLCKVLKSGIFWECARGPGEWNIAADGNMENEV